MVKYQLDFQSLLSEIWHFELMMFGNFLCDLVSKGFESVPLQCEVEVEVAGNLILLWLLATASSPTPASAAPSSTQHHSRTSLQPPAPPQHLPPAPNTPQHLLPSPNNSQHLPPAPNTTPATASSPQHPPAPHSIPKQPPAPPSSPNTPQHRLQSPAPPSSPQQPPSTPQHLHLSTAERCLEACGEPRSATFTSSYNSVSLFGLVIPILKNIPEKWKGKGLRRVREVGYFKVVPKTAKSEKPRQNRRAGYFNTFLIPGSPG